MIARLLVIALVAGCGGRQFLGAPLPASCARSSHHCASELFQRAWWDTVGTEDRELRAYVRGVAARITRVSTLRETPDVALGWFATGEVVGSRIEVGIDVIVRFDSEAELAGLLAHEIAHLEARGPDGWSTSVGTDAESLADERAITLLSRAGYPPGAFASGLARFPGPETGFARPPSDNDGDDDHPPTAERVQRAAVLVAQLPPGGDDRRAALLAAIEGRAIESTRLTFIGGRTIEAANVTFYDAGPADHAGERFTPDHMIVVLPERDLAFGAPNLGEPSPKGTWSLWPVGRAGAAEIAAALADPQRRTFAVGTATLGRSPPDATTELDRTLHTILDDIAPLGPELAIAVLATPGGGLVVTFDGPDGLAMLERYLAWFRHPTAAERAQAVHRIRLETATRTAPLAELVAGCPDPDLAAGIESGDRILHAGDRFKCAVR